MQKLIDNVSNIENKVALVRSNFDVPLEDGKVMDTTRIEDSLSTIRLLREHNCKVIILAHQGRPDGEFNQEFSLEPVAQVLSDLLEEKVSLVSYKRDYTQLEFSDQPIQLVDNIRFWQEEEDNSVEFAKFFSQQADFYVNQAFAVCHRKHASVNALPKIMKAYAGVELAKEIELLSKTRNNPDKPLVVIIGGAKLETKEPLVEVFADVADDMLVGGKVALDLREHNKQMPSNVTIAELTESGKDITEESAKNFAEKIMNAATVMWNGTMGVFEEEEHQTGTRIIAKAIKETEAFTIVGGGDTETALTILEIEEDINFISTGGGAMLTYLSEGTLPGIEVLNNEVE